MFTTTEKHFGVNVIQPIEWMNLSDHYACKLSVIAVSSDKSQSIAIESINEAIKEKM